jgi:hypothetical protein
MKGKILAAMVSTNSLNVIELHRGLIAVDI